MLALRREQILILVLGLFVVVRFDDFFCSSERSLVQPISITSKVKRLTSNIAVVDRKVNSTAVGAANDLQKDGRSTKTNSNTEELCRPSPNIHRNGHFSEREAVTIRKRYGLAQNQCLFSNIPYKDILTEAEIEKADGYPAQFWQLVKEDKICEPALITGERVDVPCRSDKNPVKYYWSGHYKGTEFNEGCESLCKPTEVKSEADFLVNANTSPISKTPGKTQYTVRYAVESIFHMGTPNNHEITMDMSPYSNVPMLYMPDDMYNKLKALPIPTFDQVKKKKLAVWAASNCGGSTVSWGRARYAAAIAKYMPVDFPGPCNHNIDGIMGRAKWTKNVDLYKNYLFVFSFHNSFDNANIDEKFYFPALGNSVPISVSNDVIYTLSLGNGSFVDGTKYKSPKALASHLLYLQQNPAEYLKLFEYRKRPEPRHLRPMYDVLANFEVGPRLKKKVMCRLCSCICDPNCLAKRKSTECGYATDWKPALTAVSKTNVHDDSVQTKSGQNSMQPSEQVTPHSGVIFKNIPKTLELSAKFEDLKQVCKSSTMGVCDIEDVAAAWISGYSAPARGWTKSKEQKFASGCKKGRAFGECFDIDSHEGKLKSMHPVAIGDESVSDVSAGLNIAIDSITKGVFCCAPLTLPQPKLKCNPEKGDWPVKFVYAFYKQLSNIFDKHGLKSWVIAGSLLGVIRDHGLANTCLERKEWSNPDIDIGAFAADQAKLAKGSAAAQEINKKLGANILYRHKWDTTIMVDIMKHKYYDGWIMPEFATHIAVEFWWYRRKGDLYEYPAGGAGPYCYKFFDNYEQRTLSIGHTAIRVGVPAHAEAILLAAYGLDWRTPKSTGKFQGDIPSSKGGCACFDSQCWEGNQTKP